MSPTGEKLTASLEDYLEAILVLSREKKVARVRDIAGHIGVAMSTVNGALKRLAQKGLVRHERYEFVELTPAGTRLAQKVLDRHNLLIHLLRDILHVKAETADKDACALEHHLSQETVNRILDFFFFIDVCPKGAQTWTALYQKCMNGDCDEVNCPLRKLGPEGRRLKAAGKEKLTLKHIRPGYKARVVKVRGGGAIRRRLMDMGISPGVMLEVKRVAPLGDPVEVRLRGYNLSLRKNEADSIDVELI